jgi:predicted NAD/FAD-binding protein
VLCIDLVWETVAPFTNDFSHSLEISQGSGVSGLSAAWLLSRDPKNYKVTLYESGSYFGGHTNTVDIPSLTDPSKTVGVDTGFIVCNPVTCKYQLVDEENDIQCKVKGL